MSVVIARFTGAVRAFVPLLAGFARMPAGRFYATNLLSALLWAPAHILPVTQEQCGALFARLQQERANVFYTRTAVEFGIAGAADS